MLAANGLAVETTLQRVLVLSGEPEVVLDVARGGVVQRLGVRPAPTRDDPARAT